MTKDIAKSVKARLLNLARKERLDCQLLVIRYLYERLLYRLSISKYREKFYLKGGALLYAFEKDRDLSFEAVMSLIVSKLRPINEKCGVKARANLRMTGLSPVSRFLPCLCARNNLS